MKGFCLRSVLHPVKRELFSEYLCMKRRSADNMARYFGKPRSAEDGGSLESV